MVVRRPSAARSQAAQSVPEGSTIQVPKLNRDPIWSLRPWPIDIRVAGTDIRIPPLCATDWLSYLMLPEPNLDLLVSDLIPDLEDLVYDGLVDLEIFYETVLEVISCVAARPWWVAMRLISVSRVQWDILGPQLLERVDPNAASLSAWLDFLLVTILAAMDPKKTTMFVMQLEAVPDLAGKKEDPFDEMEMNAGAFLSMGG